MDSSAPTARFLQGASCLCDRPQIHHPKSQRYFTPWKLCLTSVVQSARITYLSNTLIKRIGNIFEEALTHDPASTEPTPQDSATSHTGTALQQFRLSVESTALVRAAEEIMVLTRSMKDVWLFGGLDTLASNRKGERAEEAQPEDVRAVAEYIRKRLGSGAAEAIPQAPEAPENGA
jgi:hypothetical protein